MPEFPVKSKYLVISGIVAVCALLHLSTSYRVKEENEITFFSFVPNDNDLNTDNFRGHVMCQKACIDNHNLEVKQLECLNSCLLEEREESVQESGFFTSRGHRHRRMSKLKKKVIWTIAFITALIVVLYLLYRYIRSIYELFNQSMPNKIDSMEDLNYYTRMSD